MRLPGWQTQVAYAKAALIGLAVLSALNATPMLVGNEPFLSWWLVVLIAVLWPLAMTAIT